MPYKAPTPCRHPGCAALVTDGSGYCKTHQGDRNVRRPDFTARQRQASRGPMATNLAAWRKLRERILITEPLCRICSLAGKVTPASCVDHIDGDPCHIANANLQPLCHSCHSRKTAKEQNQRRRDPFAVGPERRHNVLPNDFEF